MKRKDLEDMSKTLMAEIVRRRSLGGYNADAPTLEMLANATYEIVRHLMERAPREKVNDTDQ
tara:strand:- start:1436 stop:1621 length:186 start_codon:yes stop_codon:yes gene_type:complete